VGIEAKTAVHIHVLRKHPGAVFAYHYACDGEVSFRCRRRAGCPDQSTCDQVEEEKVGYVRAPKPLAVCFARKESASQVTVSSGVLESATSLPSESKPTRVVCYTWRASCSRPSREGALGLTCSTWAAVANTAPRASAIGSSCPTRAEALRSITAPPGVTRVAASTASFASQFLMSLSALKQRASVLSCRILTIVAASSRKPSALCWDSKIVPLSYSHNTGVNGPEEFKLIVQHSS